MAPKNNSNELKITRIYDAPIQAVWDAWTDPEQVAQWWGPRGFTITTHSKDLKPGGHWSYTMHGPDGTNYENKTIYYEVEECAKLVYDHGGNDDRPPLFRVTVLFSEIEEKTLMEMTMTLPSPEAAAETKQFIKKAGGNATWDRLAEYLEKQNSGKEKFVINHSFEAPQDKLFEMFTQAKHLANWTPPKGFSMTFIRNNIEVGESAFYKMFGHGMELYARSQYLEITKPRRIKYLQQFCDKDENLSTHPLAPSWPETMLTTIDFKAEGPNQTRVTVTTEIDGTATKEQLAAFIKERPGMTLGWSGSFEKLEAVLRG